MRWLFFGLLVFCAQAFAEQGQERASGNMVYSKDSGLTVDKLNKTIEVLRDPTLMSGNFRQALRGLPSGNAPADLTPAEADEFGLPDIEIVGRVYSENKPSTVVFKANGKYHHFEEGDQLTRVINNQLVTFHVQEISAHSVRLLVMPFNKILIFN